MSWQTTPTNSKDGNFEPDYLVVLEKGFKSLVGIA
jgi:hypothetical protein